MRPAPRILAVTLAAAATASCVHPTDRYPATDPPGDARAKLAGPGDGGTSGGSFAFRESDLTHIAAKLSEARKLSVDHPVAISLLPKNEFLSEFRAHASHDKRAARASEAFGKGFDLGDAGDTDDLVASQLLGFYDPKKDRVFVPQVVEPTADKLFLDGGVIAHEIEHALQAQHFKNVREPQTSDEGIALLSLFEGDAQLAMAAYFGAEAGAPIGRTVRQMADATKDVPIAALAKATPGSTLALARTQERLDFPYAEGMMFVSDLYRAGGFPQIDAAFADPPTTSEQILHPQKYLAGEGARLVKEPRIPAGWSGVVTDVLGELDTRIILSRCLEKTTAHTAAAGWAGDRFAVFETDEHKVAMAWVSAWDTEADAIEMETALSSSERCWQNGSDEHLASNGERVVQRRGTLVVFLRGVPAAARPAMTADLFAAVAPPVRPKARSSALIPERVPLPQFQSGKIDDDVYQNDWLGIVGRIPPGLDAQIGDDDVDLTISRPGTIIHGSVTVSTRVSNDEQNERTFAEFQHGFQKTLAKHGLTLDSQGTSPVTTALGNGVERVWNIHGTEGALHMTLVPVCMGTGSIVFVEGYGDAKAKRVLDAWRASFRWANGRNIQACDYLDPK
ncbi:MAG: hypothetical protein U0414_01545 [Polyangiaceae bacterium]